MAAGVHVAAQVDQTCGSSDEHRQQVEREDIDGEDPCVPVRGGAWFGFGVDAGVVDDGVEVTERVHLVGHAARFVPVGEITDHHACGPEQEIAHLGRACGVASVQHDVMAIVDQRLGGGETESCGRAGYEDPGHRASRRTDPTGSSPGLSPVEWDSSEAAHEPSRPRRSSEADPGSAV